ncbi:MAG: hypothetical protein ABL962_15095 [Fimbriimonadaceae bacterium]
MALLLKFQEIELLSALNDNRARYIVVGGCAVAHHGYLRMMKDLDLWLEPTSDNALRVAHDLASVRFFLDPNQVARLGKPKLQMRLSTLHTEMLTEMTGLEFNSAMASAVMAHKNGVLCDVLSRNDLINNKRAVGRERDLDDAAALERVMKHAT